MKPVAIVTGGSGGIGRATAALLAEKGYRVYALSRSCSGPDGVAALGCDVNDVCSVNAAVSTVLAREGRVDLLVNNAGYGISGPIETTDPASAQALFNTNFFGQLRCAQAVLPTMRAQGSGRIVFLSSVAAPIAIPFQAFYSATKAATNTMALALRNEVAPFGVLVSAVMPGDVKTGFTAARQKNLDGQDIYGQAMLRAVESMERDEQGGMPPGKVAALIVRIAQKKRPKALYTAGGKYKLFVLIAKLLPASLCNWLVGKLYG